MYRTNDIGFKSKITAKIAKIFECESPGKINNTFNIKTFNQQSMQTLLHQKVKSIKSIPWCHDADKLLGYWKKRCFRVKRSLNQILMLYNKIRSLNQMLIN